MKEQRLSCLEIGGTGKQVTGWGWEFKERDQQKPWCGAESKRVALHQGDLGQDFWEFQAGPGDNNELGLWEWDLRDQLSESPGCVWEGCGGWNGLSQGREKKGGREEGRVGGGGWQCRETQRNGFLCPLPTLCNGQTH